MGCGGEEPPVTKAAVGLVTLKGLWNPGLFGTQHFTEDSDAQGGFHAPLPTTLSFLFPNRVAFGNYIHFSLRFG